MVLEMRIERFLYTLILPVIAVRVIMKTPTIGQAKTGDLSGVFVYKFKMAKQLTLLAYSYEDHTITLTLLALGSHENFYRDLKA
ncbi:type II toxin-antitoxin system RelE/ParE family toxin [Bartonella sp. ML70XJBT]|uniref:type II toxin-antitoxin system RelE/ParE family toxin n=1 Tax=Bartonella sp. ML70XJBT TaxID=3019096 RepID=UPI0023625BB7|nr:type II toxin-antitoxin system RelE/ParE family toxin [Bartonella sp. ML70XJBT]